MRHQILACAFAVGCGGSSQPGVDASTDVASSTDATPSSDAFVDASCGPPDTTLCNCFDPEGACCASVDSEPPNCTLSADQTICLPECDVGDFGCTSTSGAINAVRPLCNSAADCATYTGHQSCCNITCQPHRLSICVSPEEATASGLSCL